MSVKVRVVRGEGDRSGGDINDSLITSKAVARERGKQAINSSVPKKIIDGNCPLLSHTPTGTHSQVSTSRGVSLGKVTFFSQTLDIDTKNGRYFPSSSLKIEKVK